MQVLRIQACRSVEVRMSRILSFGFLVLFLGASFATVREPEVAGQFYPADKKELSKTIDNLFMNAPEYKGEGELYALIVPHAGYEYSGPVAAGAYKQLQNRSYDSVIVIGPSHREAFDGISIGDYDSFRTPLGKIPADHGLIKKLLNYDRKFIFNKAAHEKEHSGEVQFPFLQRSLKKFKLVEIIIGRASADDLNLLARALRDITSGKKVLFIASTDMSHYYPYDKAVIMDQLALAAIKKNDIQMLSDLLSFGKSELCGLGPVLTVIILANNLELNWIKIPFFSSKVA